MKESTMKNKRYLGIDIIKVISVFFVVVIHFSLNSNYYYTPLGGINMFTESYIRWIVLAGVPLFIMCTGFLNYKKEVSRKYYGKLLTVLIPYIVISIICMIVLHIKGERLFEFQKALYSIFDFTADSYSWYVNMYIGLFLIAPIFNYCILNTTQKQLRSIIFAMLAVIALPSTFNSILVYDEAKRYLRFPEWWSGIYPVIFYFLGAYIAKYKVKISKKISIPIIFIFPVLMTVLQFYYSKKPEFDNWVLYNNGSLYFVIEAFLIFVLLYSVEGKYKPFNTVMRTLSNATLEIYLFSFLTDLSIYKYFRDKSGFPEQMNQQAFFIRYFIPAVLMSFVISAIAAVVFKFIYNKISKMCKSTVKVRK